MKEIIKKNQPQVNKQKEISSKHQTGKIKTVQKQQSWQKKLGTYYRQHQQFAFYSCCAIMQNTQITVTQSYNDTNINKRDRLATDTRERSK